ncbi:hypothetical protein HIM_04985 [Hirsutella minnesotensis 3608]|uniref:Integral membrane protein n=1 Tax=Hirsutella minnesotensis 3608 TaxID=1043627 RepID=A0A0F8A0Q1_9HYPO|nr:hypothetical protein HIM_04985 [Hirsutella minnesotensis 3608]
MNSVAVYRQSTLPARIEGDRHAHQQRTVLRQKPFEPVDWPSFKQDCEHQRAPSAIIDIYELTLPGDEPELQQVALLEGLRRICTIYPYKDLQWVVAMLFFVSSLIFAIRSFFILVPTVLVKTALDDGIKVGFPVITAIGASVLLISNNLTVLAAFNINRGIKAETHDVEKKGQSLSEGYHPALLGSREWTWWPSFAELKSDFVPNAAFQAGILSMFGVWSLIFSAIAGIPGILPDPSAPSNLLRFQHIVVVPQIMGGTILALAAWWLMMLTQSHWFKPAFFSLAWTSSFLNMLGAVLVSVSGVITLTSPDSKMPSALSNVAGAWLLLLASYIQLHMVMAFYPR